MKQYHFPWHNITAFNCLLLLPRFLECFTRKWKCFPDSCTTIGVGSMHIPNGADVISITVTFLKQRVQFKNCRISERKDLYNKYARKSVYFLIASPNQHVFKQSIKLSLINDVINRTTACARWGYALPRPSRPAFPFGH